MLHHYRLQSRNGPPASSDGSSPNELIRFSHMSPESLAVVHKRKFKESLKKIKEKTCEAAGKERGKCKGVRF